ALRHTLHPRVAGLPAGIGPADASQYSTKFRIVRQKYGFRGPGVLAKKGKPITIDSMAERHVLVTGATGFIGGRLTECLAQEQQNRVSGAGRNAKVGAALQQKGVTFKQAELLDFSAMRALVEGKDIVYHVAAWLGARHGGKDMAWTLNVYATIQLLQMAAAAGVRRFVYVSSIAAYGPTGLDVVTEAHPVDVRQG